MKFTHPFDGPFSKAEYISLIFHIMPGTTNLELNQKMREVIEKRGIHNIYRFKLSGFYSPDKADFNFDDLMAEYKISEIINETDSDYETLYKDHSKVCEEYHKVSQEIKEFPPITDENLLKKELYRLQVQFDRLTDKRQALLSAVERSKKVLSSYNFFSISDIEEMEKKVENDYMHYREYKKKASSSTALISEALLFALSILFVALASYYYFNQVFFYSGSFACLGLVFNFIGCLLRFRRKRFSDTTASYYNSLGNIWEEFLQDQALTDESYEVLKSRLSEFKKIRNTLTSSELQAGDLLDDMIEALNKSNTILKRINESQESERELERKQEQLLTLLMKKEILERQLEALGKVLN